MIMNICDSDYLPGNEKSILRCNFAISFRNRWFESFCYCARSSFSKLGPSKIRSKIFLATVCVCTHNPDIKAQTDRLIYAG